MEVAGWCGGLVEGANTKAKHEEGRESDAWLVRYMRMTLHGVIADVYQEISRLMRGASRGCVWEA